MDIRLLVRLVTFFVDAHATDDRVMPSIYDEVMAKTFALRYILEPFEKNPTFLTKPMFGGLSVYLNGRMVMVIMETPGDREYKGTTSPFDLWNGVLMPMERSSHESLVREFPDLVPHPVLGKWLYLPMSSPSFEYHIELIARLIEQDDLRFGVYPKPRPARGNDKKKTAKKKSIVKRPGAKKPIVRKKISKKKTQKKLGRK